ALHALLARAEPGNIVIGASAAGALGRHFDLELLNADHTTERAYRLVSFTERPPGRARFVGRERELELLVERFEQARAGAGQVFIIVCETAITKSLPLPPLRHFPAP